MKTAGREWTMPLVVFAGALLLRGLLLMRPFDGLYGQDAFAYYNYALELRTNLLENGAIPAFFWPIGFPLHLVFAFSMLGVSPLAAQLVSVIAGALIAPLTYALTREVLIEREAPHAPAVALVAGLIVAVGGQLMISSLSIMSDATALMWATLSAWSVLRYARTLKWSWFMLAVLALSVAVITRWAMALLAVPWTLAVLVMWRKRWSAVGWRRVAVLCASAALIGGVIVGGQLLSGSHTGDLQVYSWDPINAVRREVANADGAFQFSLPMLIYYAQLLAHPAFVFPLFLPLTLLGAGRVWSMTAAQRVVLLGWPLMCWVFLSGTTYQNPRFMLAYLPPLAVLVGVGYAELSGRVGRSGWRRGLQLGVVLSLTGMLLWTYRVTDDFIGKKNIDLARVAYVQAHVPNDATVLSFGLTATVQQYTDLRVIELFHETPASLATLLNKGAVYVMIDEANIAAQWTGKSPQINLDWLTTNEVQVIGTVPPYTLLRVEGKS